MEAIGFWMIFSGSMLLALSSMSIGNDNRVRWIEQKLHVPLYVQIFVPLLAIILMMIGGHVWCIGNQGRYPGYPLDLLIEWLQ